MFLITPILSLLALPFRLLWWWYATTIGRPHFLVALLETGALVAAAATARPPLAAAATLLSTHPALWWATGGLSTLAGYASSGCVAFLALYTAGGGQGGGGGGDDDIAHAVAALVWGPLWWAGCAAGVPALLGGHRRLLVLVGRVLLTALYARATSAAKWAGPGGGAGGAGEWEGEAHPVLPPLQLGTASGGGGGGSGGENDAPPPPPPCPPSSSDLARVLAGGDLYAVLGVPRDAPAGELRAARARSLRGCHPDKALAAGAGCNSVTTAPSTPNHAAAAAVERVSRAAALLADEGRRAAYDARLAQWEAALAVTESLPVTPPVGFRGSGGVGGGGGQR